MRIVVDVSPLARPRTGIGNYIRGMVAGLAEAAGGEHELVAFGPSGPKGRERIEEALAGLDVEVRTPLIPHALRHGLEPPRPADRRAAGRPARRLPLLGLDVSGAAARPARDDDPRPRAAALPGVGRARDAAAARAEVRERRRDLRPDLRQLELHRLGRGRAARRPRGAGARRLSRNRPALLARGRGGRPRRPVRARGLDARAAQEPAGARGRLRALA